MQNFEKARLVFYIRALQNALPFSSSKKQLSQITNCDTESRFLIGAFPILTILVLSIPFVAFPQTQPLINSTLQGTVVDGATKEELIGATVSIKGTTHAVVTDAKGRFSFVTGQKFPYTLIIKYLGFETLEFVATGSPVTITLLPSTKQLNDVVVVGYGTQRRRDLTGSVSSVSATALKQPVTSFDKVLQGSVAGVQVTQSSGQPGSVVSIRIRGGNSITGGNEPLYVIDGFPVYNDNSDASAGVTSGGSVNALSSINPADIESMDVLKDASATAIYGSRGANGVVIITTKKGKAGTNTVNYETYYGSQQAINSINLITSSKDWALLKNEARVNAGKTPFYTQAQIDNLSGGTNWQQAALRKAPTNNHQLTISGGDEKTRYAIAGNYFKQNGVLLNTDFERFSGRLNLDRNVSVKFKVGTNFTGSRVQSQIADGNVVSSLLLMPPTVDILDANGAYTYQSAFETPLGNPIATLIQEKNESNTYRLLGNVFGEYQLAKGLSAKISLGADVINNKQNRFVPTTLYQGANTSATGTGTVGSKFVSSWLNENTLNYLKSFGDHSFNTLVGFTQQEYRSENVTAGAQGFVTNDLGYNDLGSASIYTQPATGSSEWALNSFLGRINYSFKQRYLFTLTGRADGSSRFGKNNKWGYFPSAAFAWNVSDEKFLSDVKWINSLKFRLSAGLTGNQEIGQYQSLSTLGANTYYFGDVTVVGFSPNRIGNPDLGWETTAQYDAGLDFSLLDDRVGIIFDAYYKKTSDLLLSVPIPYTTGKNTALQNYGTVENRGLEFAIKSDNFRGKFNWNTNFVISLNKNKILSLGEGVDYIISGPSIAQVGQPIGSFYGFVTNGIFQTTDDISKLPVYLTKNKPGDQRYIDFNNDNVITEANDRTLIGSSQPKFLTGLTNNFTYRGFDLNLILQGSHGNEIYNQNKQQLEILSGQQNVSVTALERWTPTNPSSTVPRAFEDPAATNSNRYVEDGSFLRLKNVSLGYTLPASVISRVNSKSIRVYVSGQNLHTWTKYSGFDPEVSRNGQSSLTQGLDYGLYPNYRSFLAGIYFSF
jgi:TonB-linked SusC/RagA family outer membrane protein